MSLFTLVTYKNDTKVKQPKKHNMDASISSI